jgi:hypothetical protein
MRLGLLIWRDITVISRMTAFWAAMAIRAAVLSAFIVIWADGLPVPDRVSAFDQFILLDWLMLGVLLPWTAVRCALPREPHHVAALALTLASPPSAIVLARITALCATLAALAASGLPVYVLFRQVAGLSWNDVAAAAAATVVLASMAAMTTTVAALVFQSRITMWLVSVLVLLAAVMLVPPLGVMAIVEIATAAGATVAAARLVDSRGIYASDRVRATEQITP